jgi:hypothetical protein
MEMLASKIKVQPFKDGETGRPRSGSPAKQEGEGLLERA